MNKRVILKGNLIKETNYKKILQLIGKGEQLTKLDIAYTLKISIPTVTTNINELKEEGIIEEVESDIYTGGRKPKIIRLIADSRISIGIDITIYKVTIAFLNLQKEVILMKEIACKKGEITDYIKIGKQLMEEGITELNIDEDRILGIGISIPGSISQTKGIIEQTNIGTKAISLERLYEMFDYTVYIENEANLSLLAEKNNGAYRDIKNLIYIGINQGLGGGIIVNDELFTGTAGRAGEFGHMRVGGKETGKSCRVEEYASIKNMLLHYKKKTGTTLKNFDCFIDKVNEKDEIALEILADAIEILLMTIYNLTMVFDIKHIIVGGSVAKLIKSQEILLKQISGKYKEIMDKLDLEIYFSDLEQTQVHGAALLPILDFYKINTESE